MPEDRAPQRHLASRRRPARRRRSRRWHSRCGTAGGSGARAARSAMFALAFSGVPKAGAPERMSTLEVNAPYITGAPGRTSLRQHHAEQRLGILLRQRRGERYRRHRAHQRERRDDHRLSVLAPCAIRPSHIASSKRRGLFTEMIVMTPGLSAISSRVEAARDRHHPRCHRARARRRSPCSEIPCPSTAGSPGRYRDGGSSPAARWARTPGCRSDGWR